MTKKEKAHKEMKWKEAIDMLNDVVRIKLAPSGVHGIGVFALRDLKAGDKLYSDIIPNALDVPFRKFKELRPEIRSLILSSWPRIISGKPFIYPVTKMSAFLNHNNEPNYDDVKDIVLKDIKECEEVFVDYRLIEGYKKIFKWLK
jgi:hypothetical protein